MFVRSNSNRFTLFKLAVVNILDLNYYYYYYYVTITKPKFDTVGIFEFFDLLTKFHIQSLVMGLIGCSETSVMNYQPMPRNIPEEWRSRLRRCGSSVRTAGSLNEVKVGKIPNGSSDASMSTAFFLAAVKFYNWILYLICLRLII
jgi:hypothetical protein